MNPKEKTEPKFTPPEQLTAKAIKLIKDAAKSISASLGKHNKVCVEAYESIAAELGYANPKEAAEEIASEIDGCYEPAEMEKVLKLYFTKTLLEWDKEELTEHLKKVQEQLAALQ